MPVRHDTLRHFYQHTGKKYYYKARSALSKSFAKRKAETQMKAIYSSYNKKK